MNSNSRKRRILVKQKGNYENTESDLKATYKEAGLKKEDELAPATTLKVRRQQNTGQKERENWL
jgi:hypothetical protein